MTCIKWKPIRRRGSSFHDRRQGKRPGVGGHWCQDNHPEPLMSSVRLPTIGLLVLLVAPSVAEAGVGVEWNLRARHESVDDAALVHDASAQTLRLRAAVRAALGRGWTGLVEIEAIANAGNDYNSGSNGRSAWPSITDAKGSELNQAWLGWRGTKGAVTAGRQRIVLDNQRFIGNSGWRQNEQTFDAVVFESTPAKGLTFQYAWLGRVHRVAGDEALDPWARERRLSTSLLHATLDRSGQQWTAYAYLHDDRDVAAASTATYGLRWTRPPSAARHLGVSAEIARQTPYADNPGHFGHSYWLIEPALMTGGITWKLGWEHLGADNGHSLQTPLATLHAFNGWADKFLVTPPDGLDDAYALATGKIGKLTWTGSLHDYHSVVDSRRYGQEYDVSLALPLRAGWAGLVKFADYHSDGFARDTRKLWVQLEYAGSHP
ncbi:MAG: alginate export family protein [Pseudoxanthomonas sp.]|nr:alginate export family protein [Pseudoxanthomonas sp.]